MSSQLIVLHVVESYGGGVATALAQYCSATPEFSHHLLRTERAGDFIDSGETEAFLSVRDLPRNPMKALATIRRLDAELTPSVIHAHSSFAGLYARLGLRANYRRPIIYTPHGYAMERQDVSEVAKKIFTLTEKALAKNTTAYAACSIREQQLSAMISSPEKTFYVPNVVSIPTQSKSSKPRTIDTLTVVATGRLTPARDPLYFASFAEKIRRLAPQVKLRWIGGGDQAYVDELEKAGVEVTGWLSRQNALKLLSEADLFVHTAAWDGFPMVLLEANKLRIPSFVRDIPAFATVPKRLVTDSPDHLAQKVFDAARDSTTRDRALEEWDVFLALNTREEQAAQLRAAYRFGLQSV